MDQGPEKPRELIGGVDPSLSEKAETIEQQVRDTVEGTTAAVTDTVTTVKEALTDTLQTARDSVKDAVSSMQHAFDLKRQVQLHPWGMCFGAVLAGYTLAHLIPRRRA
jgi:hypothetical protein